MSPSLVGTIKPKFHAKHPPKPSLAAPVNVAWPEDQQQSQQFRAMASRLEFLTSDRDMWRVRCGEARNLAERLAGDNNRLTLVCSEIEARVEGQARVSTLLTSQLVEVIWSFTGIPEPGSLSLKEHQTL